MGRLSLLCFCLLTVVTATISGVPTGSKHVNENRERRAASTDPRKNCETWSQWANTHTPSSTDPVDNERIDQRERDIFCPPSHGGSISKIQCTDERGEAFDGNRTDTKSGFTISCESLLTGAVCKMLDTHTVDKCPDLSMQYFCTCSSEPIVVTSPTTTTPTTFASTSNGIPGTSSSPHTPTMTVQNISRHEEDGNSLAVTLGGLLIPWWVVLVVTNASLFIVSVCITYCLYRHLKQKIMDKSTKVSPLESF